MFLLHKNLCISVYCVVFLQNFDKVSIHKGVLGPTMCFLQDFDMRNNVFAYRSFSRVGRIAHNKKT